MKRFARDLVGLNFTRVGCRTSDKLIVFSEAFSQLDNIWISASDLGSDGDFYWESTGEFFGIFDDWVEGEPALGIENHHCAHLALDKININNTIPICLRKCSHVNKLALIINSSGKVGAEYWPISAG
jgi:hypothetical protein